MRILWLVIAFVCCLGADDYVFNNSKGRLVEKSVAFVEGVSKELYLKTGVRFVIDMTDFEKIPSLWRLKMNAKIIKRAF